MVEIREMGGQRHIVVRRNNAEDAYALPPGASDELIDKMLADIIRMERDRLLAASDYVMMPDYPASEPERAAWAAYRQAWRDVPQQAGFPRDVEWPEIQSF